MFEYIYVYIYVFIYVYIYICVCVCVCVCVLCVCVEYVRVFVNARSQYFTNIFSWICWNSTTAILVWSNRSQITTRTILLWNLQLSFSKYLCRGCILMNGHDILFSVSKSYHHDLHTAISRVAYSVTVNIHILWKFRVHFYYYEHTYNLSYDSDKSVFMKAT